VTELDRLLFSTTGMAATVVTVSGVAEAVFVEEAMIM
jgi:hypothetical protein